MYQDLPAKKNPSYIKCLQKTCGVLLVISHCLWAAPRDDTGSLKVRLFISVSLGESVIKNLIRDMESWQKIGDVALVVRGIQEENISQSIHRWFERFSETGGDTSLHIDPVAFQEAGIDRVPALSLQVNGKTEITAFGATSVGWLLEQYDAGRRGNMGTYGTTYPITEPDLFEVLIQRLKQQDWQHVQVKAQERLQNKVFSYGVKLTTSRQASSKVLKLSGGWHRPMIALDVNDRQQQKAVIPWLQRYPDALILVSKGSLQQFQTLPTLWHEHPIYILPPALVRRFQLNALPVLLTPENLNHWRVTTAAVSQFSALEMVSWIRVLVSSTAQPAYALETTDNPSKALCQNVPILSAKLITSVPWKELFPIRIGLAKLGSGNEPKDRAKTKTGLCLCEDSAGMFHPGVTTGFWRPQRLIELTRSPGCLMALGGHKLPMVDQRRWGTLGSASIPKGLTYLHAHVYSLPLIEMLNMFTGIGGCTSDLVDFDLMNLSEVDPSWNHPELAALLSPDLAAYANPAADECLHCGWSSSLEFTT